MVLWNWIVFSLQIQYCCIPSAYLVVWSGWGSWLPISSRDIQLILQNTSRASLQEVWTSCLQHWTCSWVGQKACAIPTLDFRWAIRCLPVFFERNWQLDFLPCRWFHSWGWEFINQSQILYDSNWLHTH